jgi:hypothetical protein
MHLWLFRVRMHIFNLQFHTRQTIAKFNVKFANLQRSNWQNDMSYVDKCPTAHGGLTSHTPVDHSNKIETEYSWIT